MKAEYRRCMLQLIGCCVGSITLYLMRVLKLLSAISSYRLNDEKFMLLNLNGNHYGYGNLVHPEVTV